jgi:hypothetical protein
MTLVSRWLLARRLALRGLAALGLMAALLPALAFGAAGPTVVPPVPTVAPLPTLAPLPTYTPQATATERPTYTPVPTATEKPQAGTLDVRPNPLILSADNNLPITVIGHNLPPKVSLELDLTGGPATDGQAIDGPLADPKGTAKTDARGELTWRGTLPPQTKPGTYVIEAHTLHNVFGGQDTGPKVAQGALEVQKPPGPGDKPGVFCVLGNNCVDMGAMMGSLLMGSLSWWNGFQAAGQSQLAGGIVPAILQQPDLTGHQYSALGTFLNYFIQFGKAALTLLITLRVIAYVVDLFRSKPARAVLILVGEIVLVYWYAHILSGVEHSVWTWVESAVTYIGKDALKPLTKALAALTTIDKTDLASLTKFVLGVLVSLALLVVMVVMLGIILLTRIGTFVLLVALFIIAPLCIPCVLLSATRPIALWWLTSITALTALPLVYVIEISAGVAFVLALTGSGGVFDNPLVRVAAGVALIGVLLTAPELTTEAVSRIGGGGGRALNIMSSPALALATKARSKVRSLTPDWL